MKNILSIITVLSILLISGLSEAQTIEISPANTRVLFQVVHPLGFTLGYFGNFSGTIELNDAKNEVVSAKGQVDTASINTNNPVRDKGLTSNVFLDTAKFPQATFENGSLTLKGIAKPLAFTVEENAGKIILKASFDRNEFGIKYNKPEGKIKKSIGDVVELIIEINPS